MKAPVLFLVGPTACGKSECALTLALKLKGEILSADSMLVYRGMDIGTAKPTRRERLKVPHHLIDIRDPSELFSVHDYYRLAVAAIEDVSRRRFLPIVVGGTGLYVRSLLQGFDDLPGPELEIRSQLEREASIIGLDCLYRRLLRENPEKAKKIQPEDRKRIIRALEIGMSQGKTLRSSVAKLPSLTELGYEVTVVGIKKNRSDLYRDIDERVEKMFEAGLLEEVRKIDKAGISRTAAQAVGYKEVIAYLRGGVTLERAKAMVKMNTRHLAKRQETWFRREKNIFWFEKLGSESITVFADRIFQWFKGLEIASI